MKKRVFISFDYDNDNDLKVMLAGQAVYSDSPFEFKDASVKETLTGDWEEKVKGRMRNVDLMIVICGTRTNTATGVSKEIEIAQKQGKPYFLLWGRSGKTCVKPRAAYSTDKIYEWTWPTLKKLIDGER